MKFFFRVIIMLMLAISAFACSKEPEIQVNQNIRDYFLVESIYTGNNNLLAKYIYDDENRLIKKIVTDQLIQPNRTTHRTWIDSLIYQNDRVSKITRYTRNVDNYSGHIADIERSFVIDSFEYDLQGNLTKAGGREFLYQNGYVTSSYNYYLGTYFYRDSIVYDYKMNTTKHISVSPKMSRIGEPIIGTYRITTRTYEYDKNPKPNFGIDYLFAYNSFPYEEGGVLMRNLSKNNMITADLDGYVWIYTYNEYGLPATIETKLIGIETIPTILRIKYKQIAETPD